MSIVRLGKKWFKPNAPVPARTIPDGDAITLGTDQEFSVLQALGGDFTLENRIGAKFLVRGTEAEAIGQARPVPLEVPAGPFSMERVDEALRQCFDPEIPVNVLELGLIYHKAIGTTSAGKPRVEIEMTLTAPGCGMGQVLADDVKRKVEAIPEVEEVEVKIVFDPPWSPERMSEAARLEAGLL